MSAAAQLYGLVAPPDLSIRLRDSDCGFVIIGATGWIGRATLSFLDDALGPAGANRIAPISTRPTEIVTASGRCFTTATFTDLGARRFDRPALFAHYAFVTKERTDTVTLADYQQLNEAIDETLERAVQAATTIGIFLPSSGAVYRTDRSLETDLEANPYGVMKLRQEERVRQLAERADAPAAIARVFNLAGPYINKLTIYALSSILLDIAAGGPIKLRATMPVIRAYLHVADLLKVTFSALLETGSRAIRTFDAAGAEEIEVGALAQRAARVLGRAEIAIERPALSGAAANRYVGDPKPLLAMARAQGIDLAPLDQQIADTARFIADHAP